MQTDPDSEPVGVLQRSEESSFFGTVCRGSSRGKRMGFPTANLELRSEMASELRPGVYAASVAWDDREPRAAVVNLGCRPTFRERGLTFEVHVLDFDGDLYGKDLGVTLVARIRDEKRFDGQEALVEQIGRDVEKARDWFADNGVHQ